MRHKRRGRRLGRSSSHRRAMLRNLASSLFLTERDPDHPMFDKDLYDRPDQAPSPPAVRGRVVTTLQKAKEVRSLVEKCITIARNSLKHEEEADKFDTDADRNTEDWKDWRNSEQWQKWNHAMAPAVAARRHCLRLLGDKEAVQILFDDVAPRFEDRQGGYTRIMKMAMPRLGDAGDRAIIEFVGVRDRVAVTSERPSFADDETATEDELITGESDEAVAREEPATEESSEEPKANADEGSPAGSAAAEEEAGDEEKKEGD